MLNARENRLCLILYNVAKVPAYCWYGVGSDRLGVVMCVRIWVQHTVRSQLR